MFIRLLSKFKICDLLHRKHRLLTQSGIPFATGYNAFHTKQKEKKKRKIMLGWKQAQLVNSAGRVNK